MLQQKPSDPAPDTSGVGLAGALDAILASPEFQNFDSFDAMSPLFEDSGSMDTSPLFSDNASFDSFLTSPVEAPYDDFSASPGDSPFSEFLTTPILPSADEDLLTGPLIEDVGYNDESLGLFGGAAAFPTFEISPKMYPFSPSTPPLDSINPSSTVLRPKSKSKKSAPASPPEPTTEAPTRRRSKATGTRKNLKPEGLLGMEAPTQTRTYAIPSVTSRKAMPAVFAQKKRLHSAAFGGDDDDDDEKLEELSPTATEKEAIEHKRRQNTLAARKSRKRKLEHQQMLETELEGLATDREKWKARALMAQQMLRDKGFTLDFED